MKNNDRLRLKALIDAQTTVSEIPLETIRLAQTVLESLEECERRLNRGVADAAAYKQLAEYLDAKLEKAEEKMLETAAWLDEIAKIPEPEDPDCPVCKARRDLVKARARLTESNYDTRQ